MDSDVVALDPQGVFFRTADAKTLYVQRDDLASITWPDKDLVITQERLDDATKLTFESAIPVRLTVNVLIPPGHKVAAARINSQKFSTFDMHKAVAARPGYLQVARSWADGDELHLTYTPA